MHIAEEKLMFPVWGNIAVASGIALIAVVIEQVTVGIGMAFVALTSTMWTAYSISEPAGSDAADSQLLRNLIGSKYYAHQGFSWIAPSHA